MTIVEFEREIMNILLIAGAIVLGLICLFFMMLIIFAYDLGKFGSVVDASRSFLSIFEEKKGEDHADKDSERGGE